MRASPSNMPIAKIAIPKIISLNKLNTTTKSTTTHHMITNRPIGWWPSKEASNEHNARSIVYIRSPLLLLLRGYPGTYYCRCLCLAITIITAGSCRRIFFVIVVIISICRCSTRPSSAKHAIIVLPQPVVRGVTRQQ